MWSSRAVEAITGGRGRGRGPRGRHLALDPPKLVLAALATMIGAAGLLSPPTAVAAVTAGVGAGVAAGAARSAGASATTTDWHQQSIPAPADSDDSGVSAIACTSSEACTAVGDYVSQSQAYLALAERWDGQAWKVEATPDPSGGAYVELNAVACPSATSCFAAGNYDNSAYRSIALVEHWNGTSWTIQKVPVPAGATTSELQGISCRSVSSCEIVGGSYSTATSLGRTLAEIWNGSSWKIQTTPNPAGSSSNRLEAVSCGSSTACVAVGAKTGGTNSNGGVVLAETWNGKTWTIRSTPAIATADGGSLNGVSCTSPDACTAVGSWAGPDSNFYNLAERWNGTAWKVQSTPDELPGDGGSSPVDNMLSGVSCTSAVACTTTGSADITASSAQAVAEGWNGKTWSLQTTVSPEDGASGLGGVACTTAAHCVAAGSYTADATGAFTSLVEVS